jgi:excisionase family DNA binding protein
MTTTVSQMFTTAEVAERLHVHIQTVRAWIRSGELGHHDVGRKNLVSEIQLAQFLNERRTD